MNLNLSVDNKCHIRKELWSSKITKAKDFRDLMVTMEMMMAKARMKQRKIRNNKLA